MTPVQGYCPMGCGTTLKRTNFGQVVCDYKDCPDPTRLHRILMDPEGEDHIVVFKEDSFIVQHPLKERMGDRMVECDLHAYIKGQDGPPVEPGRYRALSLETTSPQYEFVPAPKEGT